MRTRTKAERNYDNQPEDVQRILRDADELEDDLRATIEAMKETINEQAEGLRVQGREIVQAVADQVKANARIAELEETIIIQNVGLKVTGREVVKLSGQIAELEDARGAVDLRPVFLMELVKMYPEIGKLIECGPHNILLPLRGADGTPGNWVPELFEWCYPQVDELPGSDEDPDQEEYIAGLEDFESSLAIATVEGLEINRRNAETAKGRRKVVEEGYKRLEDKYPKK